MKRPIDPNLNSMDNEDILFGTGFEDKSTSEVSEKTSSLFDKIGNLGDEIKPTKAETNDELSLVESEHQHSHHHHHHHHSGEHHHSNGEHHHSSGHHHSSSGGHSSHHHHSGSHHHHSGSHSSGSHHHSSHSSHSSRKKKSKMPKWLKVILIIIMIIALIVSGLGITYSVLKNNGKTDLTSAVINDKNHQEIITYNGHKYEFNENVVSFAFIGVDQETIKNKNTDEFVGCADADIIVAVDTFTGEVRVIAVPRDTMVDVDQYSDNGVFLSTDNVQLCLAYAYGDGGRISCSNVTRALSRVLMDVPIEKYYALDLSGIAPINDAIGGVTLEATYDIPAYNIQKGKKVTLRGDMAEAYVRTRNMDSIDASLNRSDRQVQYVKAFANSLLPAVRSNFGIVTDLYNTASKYGQTNITVNNATYLASLVLSKGISNFDVYTLTGEMKPAVYTAHPEAVYAEFTPSEESIMEAVLNVYYTQID